ncbi:kinase-like domain-containing protein, partial [Mycena latifolia]
LGEVEREWARHQPFLEHHGYMLRPRYHPDWLPDMLDPHKKVWKVEDAIPAFNLVLDAKRISDGVPVVLKIVEITSTEVAITSFLTKEPGAKRHTLQLLEVIPMDDTPEWGFLVMPCMRQCGHVPFFATVGEFTEFLEQVLEGLVFLHSKNIAHRDICTMNIVVDPSQMIPGGSHFLDPFKAANGVDWLREYTGDDSAPYIMKSRTEAGPMHYYYIDFGLSIHFPSFEARGLVTGVEGRHRKHIPEISETVPYDPFKVDVRLVGEMLRREFLWQHTGLDFIIPFVRRLRRHNPARRPDAVKALAQFRRLVSGMSKKALAAPVYKCYDCKERRVSLFMK